MIIREGRRARPSTSTAECVWRVGGEEGHWRGVVGQEKVRPTVLRHHQHHHPTPQDSIVKQVVVCSMAKVGQSGQQGKEGVGISDTSEPRSGQNLPFSTPPPRPKGFLCFSVTRVCVHYHRVERSLYAWDCGCSRKVLCSRVHCVYLLSASLVSQSPGR